MDITPDNTTTQPISDDQELAKALAGVLPDAPEAPAAPAIQLEETPLPPTVTPVAVAPVADPSFQLPSVPAVADDAVTSPELEGIKSEALNELRPLIDHVDISAEEKFDTYLMLIRSTDDSTLIAPAHAAAKNIADEKQRAEALLDIIKEIDYLSKKDTPSL